MIPDDVRAELERRGFVRVIATTFLGAPTERWERGHVHAVLLVVGDRWGATVVRADVTATFGWKCDRAFVVDVLDNAVGVQ